MNPAIIRAYLGVISRIFLLQVIIEAQHIVQELVRVNLNVHIHFVCLVFLDQHDLLDAVLQVELGDLFAELAAPDLSDVQDVEDVVA